MDQDKCLSIRNLTRETVSKSLDMLIAHHRLQFEKAAELRDRIKEIKMSM